LGSFGSGERERLASFGAGAADICSGLLPIAGAIGFVLQNPVLSNWFRSANAIPGGKFPNSFKLRGIGFVLRIHSRAPGFVRRAGGLSISAFGWRFAAYGYERSAYSSLRDSTS
jgi:hypothetical protein